VGLGQLGLDFAGVARAGVTGLDTNVLLRYLLSDDVASLDHLIRPQQ
jgi:hypothetical protein